MASYYILSESNSCPITKCKYDRFGGYELRETVFTGNEFQLLLGGDTICIYGDRIFPDFRVFRVATYLPTSVVRSKFHPEGIGLAG